MELLFLLLTILGIIIAVIFGYLQVVVPFIKGEVRLSKRFPFVETAEVSAAKPRRRRKKKRKRFLIPILAIGILLIIVLLIRFLVFQTKARERVPIAVISFTNHTGDEQFDYLCAAIPNLLITNLEQSEYLSVLTWERMRDLLKVLGKEEVKAVDEDLGFELCRMDNIGAMAVGSFTKAGNMFVTEVKVLDVASKKMLKTSSSQGEGVASILKIQIDELSQDIAQSVSLYERLAAPTDMRVMEVTTTSMEAYNYFLRGREDLEKWYFDDARKFLEKAVEIDSTFASAYLYLAWAYGWLENYEAKDKTLEKARAFSDKATEKERLYIEASYASTIEENPEKRFRIYEQLAKKYPKEKRVYVNLGSDYEYREQYYRAIEEFSKALELDPNYGTALRKLAYIYVEIDDYAKAIEYFKRYAAVSPGDANPFDSMGDLYFRMGQLDDALAQYKEAIFVKPDFWISSGKIAYIYALQEEYVETMKWLDYFIATAPSSGTRAMGYANKAIYNYLLGNSHKALNNLDTAEDLLEPTGFEFGLAVANWVWSWIYYNQGKLELSRDYLKKCYVNLPDIPYNMIFYHFCLGLIELQQETLDSTKVRLALIKSSLPDVHTMLEGHTLFLHDLLYAEVLLAQDSLEKSITVFEKRSKLEVKWAPDRSFDAGHLPYDKDVIARACLIKGNIDRAILEYEKLVDPDPNKRGRCLIRPTWRYKLAKLYEEKGLRPKAIEQYEKFLDIWKDADSDHPELIDAKKRVAKLKASS